jgi:hypothetical protein
MEFVDDSGQPTLVFTGANFPNELRWPSDFTGFDNPDLQQLWLQHSQFASNEAVNSIVDDVVTQVTNANYTATAACNPDTDVVDLTTMAPSSVTSPLVTEYGSLINIIAADPQSEASGGKAHAPKAKHAPKKNATKESTATPAAAQVIEVPVTLVKPQ